MRQISHANHDSSKNLTSPWSRHHLYRSYRCILSCAHSKELVSVPRIQIRKGSLLFPSHAIRPQYCSQDFHQVSGRSSPGTSEPGNSIGGISRRLDNLGPQQTAVFGINPQSHEISGVFGFSNKSSKVKTDSQLQVPVVGTSVGPSGTQIFSALGKVQADCESHKAVCKEQNSIKTGSRKEFWLLAVCSSDSTVTESQTKRLQQNLEKSSQYRLKRQTFKDSSDLTKKSKTLVYSQELSKVNTTSVSTTGSSDSYRCISKWMGRTFPYSKVSGKMVQYLPKISHKRVRGHGSFPNSQTIEAKERDSYQISPRQCSNCSLYQQEGLQIQVRKSCDDCDLLSSAEISMAPISHTSSRSQECSSRCSVKDIPIGVRVDSRLKVVSVGIQASPRSSNRPFCHGIESSTSMLRGTQSGPSSIYHRRIVSRLESLEEDLFIPTSQPPDGSSSQAQVVSRENSIGSPLVAEEQLVPSNIGIEAPSQSDPQSKAFTNSTNQESICFLKHSPNPNFMEFMKFASMHDSGIDPENITFLESDKRDSTLKQYDSALKKLVKFVKEKEVEEMTINLAISFFKDLFDQGLAPGTITTMKSALKKIFLVGFGIDLTSSYFSSIPRACARLRPVHRPQSVSWSLNEVLRLAASIDNDSCQYSILLRKTLFLLSLASGARISELSALSRDPGHIDFQPNGNVLLSPNKTFLAKNESPQDRWTPWSIVPLSPRLFSLSSSGSQDLFT
ncbi:uncharacterized protein LOC135219436 [Macrobrachium nipponense]|uniref:uncharacterized protein LOC135219436 n=1 Tax=Macrobrachium nipponense TaxID=159736 RepID=UPI0030C7EF23